jgi:hypothetical protein
VQTGNRSAGWRKSVTYEALGWHMAERLQRSPLLAGDAIDVAFTIGHNDHPEYGGLELTLCDFRANEELIAGALETSSRLLRR